MSDAALALQRLRDELRLLRSVAIEAADLLEQFDLGGSEGDRAEMVARLLRERSVGLEELHGGDR